MSPQDRQKLDELRRLEAREAADGIRPGQTSGPTTEERLQQQFREYLKRVDPERGDGDVTEAEQRLFDMWIHYAMLDQAMRAGLGNVPNDIPLEDLVAFTKIQAKLDKRKESGRESSEPNESKDSANATATS